NVPSPNSDFTAVAAGYDHSLGLKANGTIVAWGNNQYGQRNIPLPNADFTAITAGNYHSLALRSNGSIAAWGDNTYGQCNVPHPNSGFIAIAAGNHHSLGLKSDGSIVAWGRNDLYQCNVPEPNSGFIAIAAGGNQSIGIKGDLIQDITFAADSWHVDIVGGTVTAVWDNVFYIEDDNRTCGIRVEDPAHGLTDVNQKVNVFGTILTDSNGERYIQATIVSPAGYGRIMPFGITCRSLGGSDLFDCFGVGRKGVTGGKGINNIGLLVRTWGKIKQFDPADQPTWFVIDDGSGSDVRCEVPSGVSVYRNWSCVAVTGIIRPYKVGSDYIRRISIRNSDDITVLSQQ
ncbi:MAG TPA: hypothetical protein PLZ21_08870, partial [Armatimonadota bacterium]|nr:hypothetical protein [Armatimonadota bacterium]